MNSDLKYGVLGPVRVVRNGFELELGTPQQCAVLGLLLLAQGRPVSLSHLVDSIWGANVPSTAVATVRNYLSRLRCLLPRDPKGSVVRSVRGGYQLSMERGEFDLSEFERRVDQGRMARDSGEPHRALTELRSALALWRGSALAGARASYVVAERDRLEGLRLGVLQERLALEVELGHCAEVLPELEALARLHPLEERLRYLQMFALYSTGRRAEALRVYQDARHALDAELGIEPGAQLRSLHLRMLRVDPLLEQGGRGEPERAVVRIEREPDGPEAALLETRLRSDRKRRFVGREGERALFDDALRAPEPDFTVLFVHGLAGIGKSALLRCLADDAVSAGLTAVWISGRAVGSSTAAFATAATEALTDPRPVLLIDSFERCAELEPWLYEQFLPSLPARALVAVAGRRPPSTAWRADPSWSRYLMVRAIGELSADEAGRLLRARGVNPLGVRPMVDLVGGHPLALTLAAADASGERHWRPSHEMVQTLLTELVGEVPSVRHRMALHVCGHARSTTEQFLGSVLSRDGYDVSESAELFEWLRTRSFIASGPNGLSVPTIVRTVLDSDLRWRNALTYEVMHSRIGELLRSNLGASSPALSLEQTARCLVGRIGPSPSFITGRREADRDGDARAVSSDAVRSAMVDVINSNENI